MRIRTLTHQLILAATFLISLPALISSESKGFEDFFEAQYESDREKIEHKEAIITKFSEKYILTFFYVGAQGASNIAAKHVQDLMSNIIG